jgi:hypothetical protein
LPHPGVPSNVSIEVVAIEGASPIFRRGCNICAQLYIAHDCDFKVAGGALDVTFFTFAPLPYKLSIGIEKT